MTHDTDDLRCGLCNEVKEKSSLVRALFVGHICCNCENEFNREPATATYYSKLRGKPNQSYVNKFEKGKHNPDNIKVTLHLVQPDGSITTHHKPQQLTAAGNLKKGN